MNPSAIGLNNFKSSLGMIPSTYGLNNFKSFLGMIPSTYGLNNFKSSIGMNPSTYGLNNFGSSFRMNPSAIGLNNFKSSLRMILSTYGLNNFKSSFGINPSTIGLKQYFCRNVGSTHMAFLNDSSYCNNHVHIKIVLEKMKNCPLGLISTVDKNLTKKKKTGNEECYCSCHRLLVVSLQVIRVPWVVQLLPV